MHDIKDAHCARFSFFVHHAENGKEFFFKFGPNLRARQLQGQFFPPRNEKRISNVELSNLIWILYTPLDLINYSRCSAQPDSIFS